MFNLPLTKRYIPAILVLAIFILSSHMLINKILNSNNEFGKIINISGKQRMLSQRLLILAENYYEDSTQKEDLEIVLKQMKTDHQYLLTKVITPKLEKIYYKYGLNLNLENYFTLFDKVLTTYNIELLESIRENSTAILIQLDSVVKEYERYSNERLEKIKQYETYMLIATLVILLIEILFVFRPAAKEIDKNTKDLKTKEEYVSTVIESSSNAIIAINYVGNITTYNKKAEDIFGWSKDEMLGTSNLLNIIPEKYKQKHTASLRNYLITGKSKNMMLDKIHELEALRKDGTSFPIRISFGSHSDDKNTITVANITDISKEKEQEAFLIQQSKMASMGEMIGNIAHQWRQPLSAISTIASGIKVEKEFGLLDDETLGNRLDGIVDKTNYLSQTIDDFRNFFQQSKDKEEFVVNDVLKNTEQIIAATYKINDINICKNYDENKGIVCIGFANELSQVIINILNNAKDILVEKDYEEKVVKINLIEQNNNILIEIFDNAGGIPDTILPKIFEPYFTTKHQSQGTGIGLYMSSEIINSHFKGSLTASNENFIIDDTTYYGACFKINIPVS